MITPHREGGTWFADGRGSAARFSESYLLLITDSCRHTHFFMMNFGGKLPIFAFFANFWKTHPCLRKICRKRDPCLENFRPNNPPIWAVHTRTLNMLCYPPPLLVSVFLAGEKLWNHAFKEIILSHRYSSQKSLSLVMLDKHLVLTAIMVENCTKKLRKRNSNAKKTRKLAHGYLGFLHRNFYCIVNSSNINAADFWSIWSC